MGLYEAFRDKPSATRYGEIHPTAKFDVLDATLIYIFCAFGFSFLILLPGYMLKEVGFYAGFFTRLFTVLLHGDDQPPANTTSTVIYAYTYCSLADKKFSKRNCL